MRLSLLLFSSLIFFQAYGQYPATGNKQRLGYQTTGDGLVYRGNGSPSYTPSGINNAWAYIDTTAGTIYTYYAGSWHLVSAGGGGSFDGHVDSLVFNTAVTVVDSTAKMYWDANSETISVGVDGGAVYQMGEELYYPLVINKSGATIHNGQPVMVDTATLVTGDHVRIIPARNGATYPSEYVMGVATTDIPNDSTGLVTWFGYVREVKESDIAQTSVTLNAGDILYISATEPGKYTNVRPSSPAHQSTVALVVRKPSVNNITLLVRPWLAPKLDNLSNVNVTSATGLSVLRYNSTTGIWDASATPGIVAADTAAMLTPYQKDITLTTTGTSGAATFNGVTLNVPNYKGNFLTIKNYNNVATSGDYPGGSTLLMYDGDGNGSLALSNYGYLSYNARHALHTWGSGSFNSSITSIFGFRNSYSWTVNQDNLQTAFMRFNAGGDFQGTGYNNIGFSWVDYGSAPDGGNNTNYISRILKIGNATRGIEFNVNSLNHAIYVSSGKSYLQNTGIKTTSPSYTLDINATDAIRIPSGTTAQRPTGASGVVRYNSDSLRLEYHTGTAWKGIAKTEELPVATSGFPRAAPVAVILSTYTVGATDAWIICDYAGTVTLTLPSAASYPGREIMVKTIRAQSVVSASSNVAPIDSNTAGTAILAATAGKWATLVSTGSQWIIMQSN